MEFSQKKRAGVQTAAASKWAGWDPYIFCRGVAFRVLALSAEGKDEDLNNGDIRWEYSLPKFNGWNLKMAPLGICWKLLVFKFHVKLEEFTLEYPGIRLDS